MSIPGPNDYLARLPPSQLLPTMTFYGSRNAPNPRRVEIFLAEHKMYEGKQYKYVDINLQKQEHKRFGRYETPNHKVPMLIIENDPDPEDGEEGILAESVAICRYIEERDKLTGICLFGRTPLERATIEMWTRRIDFELLHSGVGPAWINGTVLAPMRKLRRMKDHPDLLQQGIKTIHSFYKELNGKLSQPGYGNYVAGGNAFTIADITLLCVLDFAAGPVFVRPKWNQLKHLKAWHVRVSQRDSVRIHFNPYLGKNGVQTYENDTTKTKSKM